MADLPAGFTFNRGEYQLDWEQWSLPDGVGDDSGPHLLLGISITTSDSLLGNAVASLVGSNGWYSLGNSYTFFVDGT